jgi:hypothetical protein
VICVCLIAVTIGALTMPQWLGSLSRARTLAAARFVAARFQAARGQAAARGTYVAVRIVVRGSQVFVGSYSDGNHNGVRAIDIGSGIDPPVEPEVSLGDLFARTRIGAADGQIPPDAADERVDMYSFAPTGTSSSGTVYLRGDADGQYAVRVLGATGRVRLLRFRPSVGDWVDVR